MLACTITLQPLGRHSEVVRQLLEAGCDLQLCDLEGTSPLHGAVMVGQLDTARLLVGAGADTRARDRMGRTPADLAKEFGFVDIMNYLQAA